ncbi:HAMP domain-containing sensor histidine kinase [Pseudokineococcus marinus]|uniref:histidine kinase n=1 Tax=Pseudokineococcus marinus TaxID=351215 RepID=A0A849BJT3_9ACTN|nr:HAMP domain-containing sensor histidine kinase [Pseudokineococcus marinus]NNH21615.1 HAMP domain-containing histidine kinase [Pseudokineococcus marinus]
MTRRRTRALLALALAPLALGAVVRLLTAVGTVPDERLDVSALAGDWVLALGALVSVLAVLAVLLGRGAAARVHREADARVAAAEEAAAEGRRLLLSRLDHELKNPLMAMRAAVANVAADDAVTADPGTGAGLRSIDQQVVRLSRLTADLRKIADVELRGVDRRPVDLAAVLLDAVEAVRDQGGAEGRDVRVSLPRAPWPLPAVDGDEDLLGLAVANLVDNAVKYTPAGGTIEVRARDQAGRVLVEVADTGPGIAAEDLPHVWEELFRSPAVRGVPGSGLGLPLVRAVAEAHGGTATAESRVGRGTVVRLDLPSSRAETTAS